MYRSNWSFNTPRAFDCASCLERGEFERSLGRVGNLNRINLFFQCNTPVSFFRFLQGLTDLQDRISPFLTNNSLKRVFKRRLKVLLRHISLRAAWTVFDWRRNLSLRRGILVLIGGTFERPYCSKGREFEQANLQKFRFDRGRSVGCLQTSICTCLWMKCLPGVRSFSSLLRVKRLGFVTRMITDKINLFLFW